MPRQQISRSMGAAFHAAFPTLVWTLAAVALAIAPSQAVASVNVAHLSQGGNVTSYSSIFPGGSPNDAIGGNASCYGSGCESGVFIFNNLDADQWFVVKLARPYPLQEITSTQQGGTGDREVWDLLEILTRNGTGPWVSWGSLPGDFNIPNAVTFTKNPPLVATEIKFRYGQHSPDYGGGGSRVVEVSALAAVEPLNINWTASPIAVDCTGPCDSPGCGAGGARWYAGGFSESGWGSVTAPDAWTGHESSDRYYRGHFQWPAGGGGLTLHLSSDDGLDVYCNGQSLGHFGASCHAPGLKKL